MRAYRYLKNAERWVAIIGLFFLGVTFASQNLGLTKISICIFALMICVRLFLKAKMKSMFKKKNLAKNKYTDDYDDYEYIFTWAVVTWTVFCVSTAVLGFLYSLDLIGMEGLSRSIWGLSAFVFLYSLVIGIKYYKDTLRSKNSGRNDITAAKFNKENSEERSQKSYLKENGGN